jgi:hypothetical protein
MTVFKRDYGCKHRETHLSGCEQCRDVVSVPVPQECQGLSILIFCGIFGLKLPRAQLLTIRSREYDTSTAFGSTLELHSTSTIVAQ